MGSSFKIRALLLLLTFCFAGTAITINLTFHKEEVLLLDARRVERNLQQKEQQVYDLLADSAWFSSLRGIDENEYLSTEVVDHLAGQQQIYLYTYSNNELVFWGTDQVVPRTDAGIPEGSSMLQTDNGYYQSVKKSQPGWSVVFLIPVKSNFPLQNSYLQNSFSDDLIRSHNLEMAGYQDSTVYNVRSVTGDLLFSLKLKQAVANSLFSVIELIMWLLTLVSATVFVNTICVWIARQGRVLLSIVLFLLYFVAIRYADLDTSWLATHFYGGLFDPRNFASSFFFPSLGAFLLNMLAASWFMCYVYAYRYEIGVVDTIKNVPVRVGIFILLSLLMYVVAWQASEVFNGLIVNSSINFDVTNILSLNIYSWIGIFIWCLCILNIYFLIEVLLVLCERLQLSGRYWIVLAAVTLVVLSVVKLLLDDLTVSFFIFAVILLLRGWYYSKSRKFNLAVFISILLLFSGIASLKHAEFQSQKQQQSQEVTLLKLSSSDDPNVVMLFIDLEQDMVADAALLNYYRRPRHEHSQELNEHLRKMYLSGYMSRYEFNIYAYDHSFRPIGAGSTEKLEQYKDRVMAGAIKVSQNFYRMGNTPGNIEYFGLLPITDGEETIGTLLIELRNSMYGRRTVTFPDLLVDGRIDNSDEIGQYAYAVYRDGRLVGQHGPYVFGLTDERYPQVIGKPVQLASGDDFSHLVYRPDARTLIVLSKPIKSTWTQLASLSFLFLVLLLFSILTYTLHWVFKTLKDYDFSLRNLRWSILISQNKILYSTRIQAFVVLAVVLTLIVVGIITFFSISRQYKKQQEEAAQRQATDIASRLEDRFFQDGYLSGAIYSSKEFNIAADANAADLNLYNATGELMYSSQPRIYDLGLISRFMNPKAMIQMGRYERSEYLHREKIGDLNYIVAYARISNERHETIGFLSLPNFSNQKEIDERIGLLLNTLINIYALVIVALGLFAVFVANQITAPLTLVQRSLARTTIGRLNEPIFWKRNDEIGSLIKEYNTMIVALEHSAERIVRSERESAWREMAKQVAHEIKNPLTPLKLGVQLLERSWKEKDPQFEQKFERFSKSFIEQIDSLSRIASEFSDFAKLPDTRLDDVDIRQVAEQAIGIFDHNGAVIHLQTREQDNLVLKGDNDQLLRSFINLLKNAVEAKASRRKCEVRIRVTGQQDQILVIIKDNGKGIDHEVRTRIFQPNFTTKSSGTGLGLAFVKKTVESMGGSIHYETEIDKGTTFFIRLPRQPATPILS